MVTLPEKSSAEVGKGWAAQGRRRGGWDAGANRGQGTTSGWGPDLCPGGTTPEREGLPMMGPWQRP